MQLSTPSIGLMLSDPDLRDQVFSFLRTGGYQVVNLDEPLGSSRLLGNFDMLIVSHDVGLAYHSNLLRLKQQLGRPYPILVVCGRSSEEAMAWVEAGFDDALPLPMGQPVMCQTVDA